MPCRVHATVLMLPYSCFLRSDEFRLEARELREVTRHVGRQHHGYDALASGGLLLSRHCSEDVKTLLRVELSSEW